MKSFVGALVVAAIVVVLSAQECPYFPPEVGCAFSLEVSCPGIESSSSSAAPVPSSSSAAPVPSSSSAAPVPSSSSAAPVPSSSSEVPVPSSSSEVPVPSSSSEVPAPSSSSEVPAPSSSSEVPVPSSSSEVPSSSSAVPSSSSAVPSSSSEVPSSSSAVPSSSSAVPSSSSAVPSSSSAVPSSSSAVPSSSSAVPSSSSAVPSSSSVSSSVSSSASSSEVDKFFKRDAVPASKVVFYKNGAYVAHEKIDADDKVTEHVVYREDVNVSFQYKGKVCMSKNGTSFILTDSQIFQYFLQPRNFSSCKEVQYNGKTVTKYTFSQGPMALFALYVDANKPVAVEILTTFMPLPIPALQVCSVTLSDSAPMKKFTFDKTEEAGCEDASVYEDSKDDCTASSESSTSESSTSESSTSESNSHSTSAASAVKAALAVVLAAVAVALF